ncbi:MAG: archaeosortase/exosortase family protein [Betaproteobacteria bacterium]
MWSAVDRRLGPGVLFALQIAALWPFWIRYARRTTDGSDEPWGVVALLAAAAILWLRRGACAQPPNPVLLAIAGTLTLVAVAAAAAIAPLAGAVAAVGALGCTVGAIHGTRRIDWPWMALAALALPVVSSLQFYLGYPLRWLTAGATVIALGAAGMVVDQRGSMLSWMGHDVMVDAPCSGVHMLWAGMLLAAFVAALRRMAGTRFARLLACTAAVVLAANAGRNTALFLQEVGSLALPAWTHEGIGVVSFAFAAAAILRLATRGANEP